MWFRTLMNVSCARSSDVSRSRTMRKMSEKIGRSYRRTSSRNASSRPRCAQRTTSASGRFWRSRVRGSGMYGAGGWRGALSRRSTEAKDALNPGPARACPHSGRRRPFFAMTSTGLEAVEARAAASGGANKRAYVRRIFSEIAPRYDLLNHVLSLNIDRGWRRAALAELEWNRRPDGTYLDLCAGTLDVGALLARMPGFQGRVIGADFAEPMLKRGVGKADSAKLAPVAADALSLPVRDGTMAGAIVAFGVRNLVDLDAGFREVRRVLMPGARFVILEFSSPPSAIVRAGYRFYSHRVLPTIGRIMSGHPTAYQYLPESVDKFPGADDLAACLTSAGFGNVRWRHLTFGVVAIHVGERW